MKPKISVITLGVENIPRSAVFYKALGFPMLTGDGDDFIMFDLEGTKLALFPKKKLAEDAGMIERCEQFSGITLAHNVSTKEDVSKVLQEAVTQGAQITKKAHDTFWGGHSGYFQDLDGYLWEIAWNPFTDLT